MAKKLGVRAKLWVAVAACLAAMTAMEPATAEAQFGPQPKHQLYYSSTTVARVNPLGLINFTQLTYRRRLFQTNSIFFRDNYFGIGVSPSASPAFGRIGLMAELQPIPFLRFWANYEVVGYFGTFEFLPSFQTPNVNYSDSALDDIADAGENYATSGTQLTLSGTLQAKLGPVAVRSVLRAVRPNYDLREGDTVFYDIFYDAMIADEGWLTTIDTDLLYLHQDRFTVGLRHTWTRSYFDSDDTAPGVMGEYAEGVDPTLHRAGVLFAFTAYKEYKKRFNGPTLLVLAQWWLRHPFRANGVENDVTQALPYLLVGFSFSGDLLADE
ncbi:MAG: hypothetical protein CMN31_18735 [Sandaracinus sp.]|nr:hypothetical protein [Myxococcales bacterium]MAT28024.1 hypothetical protein [Sandaracinus sp.]MBJ73334.1 hypothetical protein [Sandaracinus sp.]HJL32556.1 hypothetical protein [Polyangiaceae bacterium LLY-WYZ-15_(1-7)]